MCPLPSVLHIAAITHSTNMIGTSYRPNIILALRAIFPNHKSDTAILLHKTLQYIFLVLRIKAKFLT